MPFQRNNNFNHNGKEKQGHELTANMIKSLYPQHIKNLNNEEELKPQEISGTKTWWTLSIEGLKLG